MSYTIAYTVDASESRHQLDQEARDSLDKTMDAIAEDPYRRGTHALSNDSKLRQVLTDDLICVTYTVVDEITLVVTLAVFRGTFGDA